jgi:hypothetical protein
LFSAIVHKTCLDKLSPLLLIEIGGLAPEAGLNAIGRGFLSIVANPEGRALFRMLVSEADRFPELAREFFAAGPETVTTLVSRHIEQWKQQGLLRAGNSETRAVQFLGIMLGNFHIKNLLGLTSPLSAKEINDWVASGVTLFLLGCRVE